MNRLDMLLWLAIQEDLGHKDVTTDSVVDVNKEGVGIVVGREAFVLSGSRAFTRVFQLLDPSLQVQACFRDGERVPPDVPVFRISGSLRSLLTGERTALNLLQRFSGVATMTRKMVDAMSGTACRLLDTRKTTPLWRSFEKEAVLHGGGNNHRFGLYDGILIKDNHLAAAGGVAEAIRRARENAPHTLRIEVEVENLEELEQALTERADIVLLDNFPLETLREAVARAAGRCLLEASGGINLDTVRAVAETGVNYVSCGALTHSARAIDLSLEIAS